MATEEKDQSQMGSFIKQLFSSSAKAFDVFNLGRLFFYTAAGSLTLLPFVMILQLITLDQFPPTFVDSLKEVGDLSIFIGGAGSIGNATLIVFIILSVIVGFLIANVGFMVVIRPLKNKLNRRLREELSNLDEYSISYHYPQLKNNQEGEDYEAWLSTEYFRFVEIAVYIPIGFMLGLVFFTLYVLIYLFRLLSTETFTPDEIFHTSVLLLLLGTAIAILKRNVWSEWWHPYVVEETMFAYLQAKASLIKGLEKLPSK